MMTESAKESTHNGWTNYETWCVNLWITNDSDDYNHWRGRAAELAASLAVNEDVLKYHVGDALKEEFDDLNPLGEQANVWADLMNAALSEVDWSEIAEHLLDPEA